MSRFACCPSAERYAGDSSRSGVGVVGIVAQYLEAILDLSVTYVYFFVLRMLQFCYQQSRQNAQHLRLIFSERGPDPSVAQFLLTYRKVSWAGSGSLTAGSRIPSRSTDDPRLGPH